MGASHKGGLEKFCIETQRTIEKSKQTFMFFHSYWNYNGSVPRKAGLRRKKKEKENEKEQEKNNKKKKKVKRNKKIKKEKKRKEK